MPIKSIDKAIKFFEEAKDLLKNNDDDENLDKAIELLVCGLSAGTSTIPTIIKKMKLAVREDARNKAKKEEKIRRAVLVQKLADQGLNNAIIGKRLNMTAANIACIKKEILLIQDTPEFKEAMQ